MTVKLFVCIFFGLLIFTTDIAYGRKLVGKEKKSLADEVTSKIGCSPGDVKCKEGHEYNRKESHNKYNAKKIWEGIRKSYSGDNRGSIIQGEGCVNGDPNCNKNTSHVIKKGCRDMENSEPIVCYGNCNFTYNSNNRNSDNGSDNNLGNDSGSGNGGVDGTINQDGNHTTNGSGSSDSVAVAIGAPRQG
ncbi:unnamed protein product [Lactuca saligna]|uniref:Uncharacterized protein n=1 Tax=Lactuca saligna TaxID=75948 RepID=A0AA35ZNQ1_LACSI|nr:unnamed protein product [Lactuca saligna]